MMMNSAFDNDFLSFLKRFIVSGAETIWPNGRQHKKAKSQPVFYLAYFPAFDNTQSSFWLTHSNI